MWYVDDATAGGCLCQLKNWWDKLCSFGRPFGYNVDQSWLVVREESLQSVLYVFAGTGVQITSVGHPYLGAALRFYATTCYCMDGLLGIMFVIIC